MYYETDPRKKKQKRAKRRRGCLSRLFRLAFIALVIGAVFMLASGQLVNWGLLGGAPESLAVNAGLPGGYTNVLLLGCDSEASGRGRNDSTLVASISGAGEIKLTSLMRDMMLDMGSQGVHKLNAAYRFGGGELAMYTVNKAFGLNATKYAAINFEGIAKVIDSMGGIELNITKAEMEQINDGLKKAYAHKRVYNGVLMTPLTEYGKNIHMSGTHALFYSRIRNIDSDYKRAERQRTLIEAMLQKVRRSRNPVMLLKLATAILECTETNLSLVDMTALGVRALSGGEMKQFRAPPEGAYTEGTEQGVWVIRPDLQKCRAAIYEFIYD